MLTDKRTRLREMLGRLSGALAAFSGDAGRRFRREVHFRDHLSQEAFDRGVVIPGCDNMCIRLHPPLRAAEAGIEGF